MIDELGMENQKDQLYFEGKYFDNQTDFWLWVQEWKLLPLDQETADRHLNFLKKDIILNLFLRDIQFNNVEFKSFLQKIFEFAMREIPCKYITSQTNDSVTK